MTASGLRIDAAAQALGSAVAADGMAGVTTAEPEAVLGATRRRHIGAAAGGNGEEQQTDDEPDAWHADLQRRECAR